MFNPATFEELNLVRYQFPNIESLEQADSFIEKLNQDKNPLSQAYVAAMFFMKSRFDKFPLTKLKHFNKGKKKLDRLIFENPNNLEMRYIRYLIQSEIPKFLGYNKNLDEDFLLFSQHILKANITNDLKFNMLNNMSLTSAITPEKKSIINSIQKQL
jgi:hypothetical protein